MINKLIVSPSPHIKGSVTTSSLMRDVILALIPTIIVGVIYFGFGSLLVTAVAVVSCMFFEFMITRFMMKKKNPLGDYSAALTGLLLALNLPPAIPLWIVVIGSFVAIVIGKASFGGLGNNPFNPALVGRVFLLISFPVDMTNFSTAASTAATATASATSDALSGASSYAAAITTPDALSGATPLSFAKEAIKGGVKISDMMADISYSSMFLGDKGGSIGEVGALALLLGFVYLLVRKVITWHIPVYIIVTMALFSGIFWLIDSEIYLSPIFQVLSGGALLGAIFMATDYVTSPMNRSGMAIYGVGIGMITIIVRMWGSYPEGISFAILIMNALTPLINKYTKPKRFGKTIKVNN